MSGDSIYHLDLIIDDLTNNIRQINTNESFETDLTVASSKDIKLAIKKYGWHFAWKTEFNQNDRIVYKLTWNDEPKIIQGLISFSEMTGFVYVHLAESAPIKFGLNKKHDGVGGNLFAYACKRSWDVGNDGFISFQAKTKLISHYEKILGAVHNGGHNMIIYPQEALYLIKQYFNVKDIGYIRELKNVDLVVRPSVFTQEAKYSITQAIAQYKKTGKKPDNVEFLTQRLVKVATHIGRTKPNTTQPNFVRKKQKYKFSFLNPQ